MKKQDNTSTEDIKKDNTQPNGNNENEKKGVLTDDDIIKYKSEFNEKFDISQNFEIKTENNIMVIEQNGQKLVVGEVLELNHLGITSNTPFIDNFVALQFISDKIKNGYISSDEDKAQLRFLRDLYQKGFPEGLPKDFPEGFVPKDITDAFMMFKNEYYPAQQKKNQKKTKTHEKHTNTTKKGAKATVNNVKDFGSNVLDGITGKKSAEKAIVGMGVSAAKTVGNVAKTGFGLASLVATGGISSAISGVSKSIGFGVKSITKTLSKGITSSVKTKVKSKTSSISSKMGM